MANRKPQPRRHEPEGPLPQHPDAERAVLGAILLKPKLLGQAELHIVAGDFFNIQHKLIYEAIQNLDKSEGSVDTVTVGAELKRSGNLEAAGGQAYIAQLVHGVPRVTSLEHYAKLVKEASVLRAAARLAAEFQSSALTGEQSAGEVLVRAEQAIVELQGRETDGAPEHIGKAIDSSWTQFDAMLSRGEGIMLGEPSGFTRLDRLLAGLVPREYLVLAARPSQGKTALALKIASNVAKGAIAKQTGESVGFWSLEQDKLALIMRLACMEGEVDSQRLRLGRLTKDEHLKLGRTIAVIREWPIWFHNPASLSGAQFYSQARALAQRHKLRLAVLDYLQLMREPGEWDSRNAELERVSRALRRAANTIGKISNGTVLVLSQLSRAAERKDRPALDDIRDCGSVEGDSDTVMFIYPNKKAKGKEGDRQKVGQRTPARRWLDVAKQRNGPCDRVELVFIPQWLRFEEYAGAAADEEEEEQHAGE